MCPACLAQVTATFEQHNILTSSSWLLWLCCVIMPCRYGPAGGGGFLRLHSTYRHDLKIYSSDEGRVQVSTAAGPARRHQASALDNPLVREALLSLQGRPLAVLTAIE